MGLELMYITKDPVVAKIAEDNGVDRIFVDLEYIGKAKRQGGLDTVQNHHTIEDIKRIRQVIKKARLLVRCNPIHEASAEYGSSEDEIEQIIDAGADVIMLPFFKTPDEVRYFVECVRGRAVTFPLLETPEALQAVDEIISIPGIDEIHIGLNDLSLGQGKKFLFELLVDGTVEYLADRFRQAEMTFGFGGIASPGKGLLPAERIIREHLRLGSERVILSRSFCNTALIKDPEEIQTIFKTGVSEIRALEAECREYLKKLDSDELEIREAAKRYFADNRNEVIKAVEQIKEKVYA